VCPTAQ
jgi:hypothetical protein